MPTASAAWPEDMICGVTSAMPPTARPPIAGRSQTGTPERRNSCSVRVTPRMMAIPTSEQTTPRVRIAM